MAQEVWLEAVHPDTAPQRKGQLHAAMLKHCGQDTWAMVELAHTRMWRPCRMNFDWFEPRMIKGKVLFPLSRTSQVIEEMSRIALEAGFTPIFVKQGDEAALLVLRDEDGYYYHGDQLIEFASPHDFPAIRQS